MRGDPAGIEARRNGPTVTTVAALAAAAVAVGAMWGPWFASGSATRNSFGFFRAAQVLGIEWITPFRIAWFLLPTVLAVAVALRLYGAGRSTAVALIGLGSVLGGAGLLSAAAFGVFWGSLVAAAAGWCAVVAALAALVGPALGPVPRTGVRSATEVADRELDREATT